MCLRSYGVSKLYLFKCEYIDVRMRCACACTYGRESNAIDRRSFPLACLYNDLFNKKILMSIEVVHLLVYNSTRSTFLFRCIE
jgi:hypothetical protein